MNIQPITRKELYYNNIIKVLKGEEPEPMGVALTYDEWWLQNIIDAIGGEADELTTYTRLHLFYANIVKAIGGYDVVEIEPLTREELYLKAIADKFGGEETELPSALTREEVFLAEIYENAEGGGGVEKTVTGKTITITDALAEPMKLADIEILFTQSGSGTPSPTNIRPISGYTGASLHVNDAVYPISWQSEAGTVYSGHVDLISGLLTVTMGSVVLGSLSWAKRIVSTNKWQFYATKSGMKNPSSSAAKANMTCEAYPTISADSAYLGNQGIAMARTSDILYVTDLNYETDSDFKAAMSGVLLVYELETPQTYQLTPQEISTLKGTNIIWSDANGDTTVTYMAKE